MTIDPTVIASARDKARGYCLAKQALDLWSATQRDILATAAAARAGLVAGLQPAVVAYQAAQQGAALYRSADRVTPLLADVTAALATWGGFTADEVQQGHGLMLSVCAALRDTPADGSGVADLVAAVQAQLSPPALVW